MKKLWIYILAAAGCSLAIMLMDSCTVGQPATITIPNITAQVPVKGAAPVTVNIPAQTVVLPQPTPGAVATPTPPTVVPTVVAPAKTSFLVPTHPKVAFTFPTKPNLQTAAFTDVDEKDPPYPDCISTHDKMITWICKTIHDDPPVGGETDVLRTWTPHYAKNDKVGEIWIVPALVKITLDGNSGYAEVFCVYSVDKDASDVRVAIPVAPQELQHFMEEGEDKDQTQA